MTVFDQPLVTVFPGGDARLPTEPQVLDQLDILDPGSLPNIAVSCLTSPKVGGFSRTAQAICLLDQALKGFDTPDIDSRLLQLDRLDTNIQAFLLLVMPQCHEQPGVFCAATNIAIRSVYRSFPLRLIVFRYGQPHHPNLTSFIRALFTLHWHILDQQPQLVRAKFKSLEEWCKRSQEALDTITKMVVDIAESLIAASPVKPATHRIDAMPPMYPYIVHAALRHIHSSTQREDVSWMGSAEDVLHTSLDKFFQRWNVSDV